MIHALDPQLQSRQPSLHPDMNVIFDYIAGRTYARAAIAAWRWRTSRTLRIVPIPASEYDALIARYIVFEPLAATNAKKTIARTRRKRTPRRKRRDERTLRPALSGIA